MNREREKKNEDEEDDEEEEEEGIKTNKTVSKSGFFVG